MARNKLTQDKPTLFVDRRHDVHVFAKSHQELCEVTMGSMRSVRKMYVDGTDGRSYWIGYVVGPYWLTAYSPVRVEA